MHFDSYPQLVTLVILFPAIGAFINLFWGARLTESFVSGIATVASSLALAASVLLYVYLVNSNYQAAVVNPPLLSDWIRIGDTVLIPWQQRVDTLSVTMMLVVTGVGSLIHMFAAGYMHGDPMYHRFFAYLNMFLVFMLILVTGNNFLMMFVGWEGVGLCSFLLIGFWFDKSKGVGWRNSLAARKAFIVNRIGDFGLMMGVFLIFWTFGTLDYYRPGEIANAKFGYHGEESAASEGVPGEGESSHAAPVTEGTHSEAAPAESEALAEGEEGHAEPAITYTNNDHILTEQLGVFGKTERFLEEGDRQVSFGSFSLPFSTVLVLITLFLLLGATGKSAQIPLFVWLPDAMAGPTPVSALIHAATMVTAGVYLMVRANIWFYEATLTSFIVAIVGAATAITAGFIAAGQWDIKRVLAYSTVSQLGFMVAAVGVGAYSAAVFHLLTHAFFKALLFLGSGSVIHGVEHGHHHAHGGHGNGHAGSQHGHGHDTHAAGHHEEAEFDPQDMRNMGGLWRKMPVTYLTYLIGTLALAGIFPLAGFWSKDEILADSWLVGIENTGLSSFGGYIAFGLLVAAAGFTAFYMWRQVELVFHGQSRTEAARKASESSWTMTIPLLALMLGSAVAGFINVPSGVLGLDSVFGAHRFTDWLSATLVHAHAAEFQWWIAIATTILALGAILASRSIYGRPNPLLGEERTDPLAAGSLGPAWSLANAKLYWDEFYYRVFERPFNVLGVFLAELVDRRFWAEYFHNTVIRDGFNAMGEVLSKPFDLGIIDGIVNGIGRVTRWASGVVRHTQTGYVRTYALTLLLGVVIVIIVLLLPLLQSNG